jgi:hypothetical protein
VFGVKVTVGVVGVVVAVSSSDIVWKRGWCVREMRERGNVVTMKLSCFCINVKA